MERTEAAGALAAEVGGLLEALRGLSEDDAVRPTRCAPWDVAALAAHTVGALRSVVVAVDGPEPERAEVTAAGYYAPDVRFSPEVNRDRVDRALDAAARRADAGEAGRTGAALWRDVRDRVERAAPDRVVRTRHGDAMLLTDFLVTRVVEVLLHGLDLADALGREPWAAPGAVGLVGRLLFGGADPAALERSGVSGLAAVRAATGRSLPGRPGPEAFTGAGVRFLALGPG
ncbi:maleylpyruvate isomerase family mycothiol-dependent enzyme [Nocardiopsis mangrovi]|uniref:Maleylpyruvate isomerase family mycothiol-dependent enzyme n=1 Tax=Nocardiopsis mangrovi TaxID=1179818 RepID=A0ABV9DSL2_9ACTN